MDLYPSGETANGKYRYWLRRAIEGGPADGKVLLMLACNPSKASLTRSDATMDKMVKIARVRGGYREILVGNLWPFRTPHPQELKREAGKDPECELILGEDNDEILQDMAMKADDILLAYGDIAVSGWNGRQANEKAKAHAERVIQMLRHQDRSKPLLALGLTRKGNPTHPGNRSFKAPFIFPWLDLAKAWRLEEKDEIGEVTTNADNEIGEVTTNADDEEFYCD